MKSNSSRPTGLVYGFVMLMLLIWGGNYIAAKVVFREIPANIVICLRTILAGVIMLPIYWVETRKKPPVCTWPEFRLLVTLGLGGITVNQVFWTLGMARTTVVHSSMIMATTPLWVLLIAAVMSLERVTIFKAVGLAIAMTGVVMLQLLRARGTGGEATLLGDFYVLICALAMAGMTAWGKRHKPLSGSMAVNVVGYVGGAIVLLPFLPFAAHGFEFSKVSTTAWLCLLYMGALSSVAGYLIFLYALERMPASRMAAFQYLQPVFASGLAVLLLHEHLGVGVLVSGAVIFTGVFVTERFG